MKDIDKKSLNKSADKHILNLMSDFDIENNQIDQWERQRLNRIKDMLVDSVYRIKKKQDAINKITVTPKNDNNKIILSRDSFYEFNYAREKDGSYSIIGVNFCAAIEVHVPDTYCEQPVKYIADYAFADCKKIEKIFLPNSITKIGACAFANCSNLKEVILPDSLTEIEEGAFLHCCKLENITIPENTIEIGSNVFSRCESLQYVILPKSLKKISSFLFSNCSSLKCIDVPKEIKIIENGAFQGCQSLLNIIIPQCVEKIEAGAFDECYSLFKATFEKTNEWYITDRSGDKKIEDELELRNPQVAAKLLRKYGHHYFYNISSNK